MEAQTGDVGQVMARLERDGILIFPGARGAVASFNLNQALRVERRVQEVESCTPGKAPELLASFNRAWSDFHDAWVAITHARDEADRRAEEAWSRAILDRAPEELKKRGLATDRNPAGSQDLREAVATADPEVIQARDQHAFFKALAALVEGRMESCAKAYQSVKKILESASQVPGGNAHRTSVPMSGDYPDGFGSPRI